MTGNFEIASTSGTSRSALADRFARFVAETDNAMGHPRSNRLRILRYGLVGEIGSIVAAVKKRLLADERVERHRRDGEIIAEELGDALWYCFALDGLCQTGTGGGRFLDRSLGVLRAEVASPGVRGDAIREWLGHANCARFSRRADLALATGPVGFNRYQALAYLTARTSRQVLIEVCLTVLTQLGAELLRQHLPLVERTLNTTMPDRPEAEVLSEILWHLAALATECELRLADVAHANMAKLTHRFRRDHPTPSHDDGFPAGERLPRRFEITIETVGTGGARMVLDGQPLGDDLTDNARDPDGYRFHDVMHLANLAMLGWSPVLRGLMKRKRKSNALVDEVEDGARAQIVEEAVVKIIHSEGQRVARERGDDSGLLFAHRDEVSFSFLKLIRGIVAGLEAERNRDWEWEDAILAGHRIFAAVRQHGDGVITVDMDARTLTFEPSGSANTLGTYGGLVDLRAHRAGLF